MDGEFAFACCDPCAFFVFPVAVCVLAVGGSFALLCDGDHAIVAGSCPDEVVTGEYVFAFGVLDGLYVMIAHCAPDYGNIYTTDLSTVAYVCLVFNPIGDVFFRLL